MNARSLSPRRRAVIRFADRLFSAVRAINIGIFAAVAAILGSDMALRYLGQSSIPGGHEIVGIVVVYLYTLGMVEVYRSRHDIALTFFVDRLPEHWKPVHRKISGFIVIATLLTFSLFAADEAISSADSYTPYLALPISLYYIPLTVTGVLVSLAVFIQTFVDRPSR